MSIINIVNQNRNNFIYINIMKPICKHQKIDFLYHYE